MTVTTQPKTFIEMFSGIGGFRLGLERSGWECLWANDKNKYANQIYTKHFGNEQLREDKIQAVDARSVPDHSLLTAGFPCQSFSIAGKRKGFQDTRGTLFFDICRLLGAKQPMLFLLENVRGLLSHDKGATFAVILESLEELGYYVEWQVLNSKHFGVPQNRQRVFIIGHLRGTSSKEVFPIAKDYGVFTEESQEKSKRRKGIRREISSTIDARYGALRNAGETYIVADRTRTYAQKGRNLESPKTVSNSLSGVQKDNLVLMQVGEIWEGSQCRVYDERGIAPTVHKSGGKTEPIIYRHPRNYGKKSIYKSTERYPSLRTVQRHPQVKAVELAFRQANMKQGRISNICHALDQGASKGVIMEKTRIRRLTPTECERLQGFPDGWTEKGLDKTGEEVQISDTQRYKLLGNAVTVNVIEFLGERILDRCIQ